MSDLRDSLPEEPGEEDGVVINVRLPCGDRVCRSFRASNTLEVEVISLNLSKLIGFFFPQNVYAFVGSLDSMNPHNFQLKISDYPRPRVVP